MGFALVEKTIAMIRHKTATSHWHKGKLVLFWPPEYGLSVIFFKIMVFITKNILRIKDVKFHPTEVNRIKSKAHAKSIVERSGFNMLEYRFGIRDLFTYCVIVAEKT